MTCWEYMVIHLNVEPPTPPPKTPTDPAVEAGHGPVPPKPVFSRSFLAKEFPHFYEGQPPGATTNQPQHPAQQLQTFLNGHGSQGWELVGVFPVGMLSMLFFRRPKAAAPQGPAQASEQPPQQPADEGGLQAVLRRLDALDQRLPAGPAAGTSSTPGSGPAGTSSRPAPQVGDELLGQLAAAPSLASLAAAQAIGLRSSTSLANLGARHGYVPGLYKVGFNGLAAVYCGLGSANRGGKPQRLWWVIPADQLPGGAPQA
jgi:hypothetical protein